jgi:hypothetical protein
MLQENAVLTGLDLFMGRNGFQVQTKSLTGASYEND